MGHTTEVTSTTPAAVTLMPDIAMLEGLIAKTRWICQEYGIEIVTDDSVVHALQDAYKQYVSKTKCLREGYTINTASSQMFYELSSFGVYADWEVSNAYVLGDIVVPTVENGHKYKCTLAGNSNSTEPSWGTDANEVVTDGAITWVEHGSSASAGSLMSDWDVVIVNSVEMDKKNRNSLPRNWRNATSGIPGYWVPWDGRQFGIYPAPDAIYTLYVEGPVLPDLGAFDALTDSPLISPEDYELLACYAAVQIDLRDGKQTTRLVAEQSRWNAGIKAASHTINGDLGQDIQRGGNGARFVGSYQ